MGRLETPSCGFNFKNRAPMTLGFSLYYLFGTIEYGPIFILNWTEEGSNGPLVWAVICPNN